MINILKPGLFVIFAVIIAFSLAGCSNGGSGGGGPDAVITVSLGGGVNMTMNRINSGSFRMGDPAGGDMSWAQPQHSVTLSKGFYMGIHQVTQEQWTAVMTGSDNNPNPSYFTSDAESGEVQIKRPVESITWFDAIEFCNRLSERAGLEKVYTITGITRTGGATGQIIAATVTAEWSKNGFRLPFEAEWEYACRAGTTTDWSFGTANIDNFVWYYGISNSRTHQVGKKTANAWGLFDTHGNVWEWCWDWYDDYDDPPVAKTDPRGPASGTNRVIRGGSWSDSAEDTRSADRIGNVPGSRGRSVGFRVVR